MKRLLAQCLAVLASALVAPAPALAADARASADTRASGIDRSTFDPAVRARDDLFRHVNGHWLETTPIPTDQAYIGSFEVIHDRIQGQLRTLVEAVAAHPGSADERRVGDLYASFLDVAGVEKAGLAPLAGELAAIDRIATVPELAAAMGRLARLGANMPIGLSIEQDARDATRYVPILYQAGLGLPDRDYYLVADDARFRAARDQYALYLKRLFELSHAGGDAAADASAVLALETALARGQWTRVENRDPVKTYNRVEIAALASLAPGLDWAAWLGATGLAGKASAVVVAQPSYLAVVAAQLQATPLATWKAYLRARLLASYARYLGEAFVSANFAFAGTALAGVTENEPRWKRGLALINGAEGEALGKLYVDRYFTAAAKSRMEKLVANLLGAYRESIETLDWMGPATKKEAQAKLALLTPKIGYPKHWRDYSALEIRRDDLLGNVERARAFEYARNLAKLGQPVDRDEWGLTPQTVNAYYDASLNEVVFPASVLQPPFFDAAADDAVNYGAIGSIIGHEISHGFDDEGSKFDGKGNLRAWWTDADRKRFDAKTAILVEQYAAFSPI
ncbi:MAG: M13-type metalloendopeptidase, partial [Caldimonas sp.]